MNIVAAPAESKFCCFADTCCGTNFITIIEPAMPTGTLTKNIQCHDIASISIPPNTGPAIIPIETIPPIVPKALPLSCQGKASVTRAAPSAAIIDAPMPWIILKKISQ